MKFVLYKKSEFPPTSLLNPAKVTPAGRLQVPVSPEPFEDGWKVETDDAEAAVCALKDYGFVLLEPAEWQFPAVPNFDGDYLPSKFKFKAGTPEEIKLGRYYESFLEKVSTEKAAERAAMAPPPEGMTEDEEVEQLKQKLRDAGIKFSHLAGIRKLREQVAALPATGEE